MSLIGKAIIKSVGKGLSKKYGGDVINKLEEITKNTQEKLDKKLEEKKKSGNYNEPPTTRTRKWRKFWFYFALSLFLIIAILLYIDNHKDNTNKNNEDKNENKTTIIKEETKNNIPKEEKEKETKEETSEIPNNEIEEISEPIIEKQKYKVIIHIDFNENVLLNRYDVLLQIGNKSKTLTHGENIDYEIVLEEGEYDIKFISLSNNNISNKMKLTIKDNMKIGYNIYCRTEEIEVTKLYTNIIDKDGKVDEEASMKLNFIYDISFREYNGYSAGGSNSKYIVFDLDSNKVMYISDTTHSRTGKHNTSYEKDYTYSGNINEKIILEKNDIKKEYIRKDDKLIRYDENGKIIEEYTSCNLEWPMNVLKNYTSYFKFG